MNQLQKICQQNPELAVSFANEILQLSKLNKEMRVGSNVAYSNHFNQSTESDLFNDPEKKPVELSIVLPIYNEEENIPELYRRLSEVIKNSIVESTEFLFVNDGSRDRSVELITEIHKQDSRVKLVNLSRNFGHQAAISAGIDYSKGDAIVLMDADLQDPPEVLEKMLGLWREGAEVVYTVRQKHKDEPLIKKITSFVFYRILKNLANIDIPLDSGDFCLMDRKVVDQLKSMPERNRYLRGLRSWIGYKQVAITHERNVRFAGEPKYTIRKSAGLALNGIISFSSFPLRLSVYAGFLTCLASVAYFVFTIAAYLLNESIQGWTSLVVIILFLGGVQLILLGVIGEYIARIYEETKQRPNYIVRDYLN
jgi:dolichol-phosphate mannosyltransferase